MAHNGIFRLRKNIFSVKRQRFLQSLVDLLALLYCGQTVGWIKMKLGMVVGLGPGNIVLDGDLAPAAPPPKKGA